MPGARHADPEITIRASDIVVNVSGGVLPVSMNMIVALVIGAYIRELPTHVAPTTLPFIIAAPEGMTMESCMEFETVICLLYDVNPTFTAWIVYVPGLSENENRPLCGVDANSPTTCPPSFKIFTSAPKIGSLLSLVTVPDNENGFKARVILPNEKLCPKVTVAGLGWAATYPVFGPRRPGGLITVHDETSQSVGLRYHRIVPVGNRINSGQVYAVISIVNHFSINRRIGSFKVKRFGYMGPGIELDCFNQRFKTAFYRGDAVRTFGTISIEISVKIGIKSSGASKDR